MRTIHLDLFSGIGGFHLGLKEAGIEFTDHYFSEIDKHAIANYKYNFKNAQYIGTVTNVRHIIRTINKQPGDRIIITFGSPCQDFSLAGKRAGLDGSKSSLIKFALFLIRWLRPDVYIWENVKGAFSTNNGADFWGIVQAFANIGGYGLEWQLVNSTWVIPQNRERIYLIGHLADRSKPGVFPFTEDDGGADEGAYKTADIRTLNAGDNSGGLHSAMTLIKYSGVSFEYSNVKTIQRIIEKHDFIEGKPKALDLYNNSIGDVSPTLTDPKHNNNGLFDGQNIRRLTEIECERLQTFPDGHTEFGIYEKQVWINKEEKTFKIVEHLNAIPRSQRYKLLGNAVTKDIVKMIGLRLKLI